MSAQESVATAVVQAAAGTSQGACAPGPAQDLALRAASPESGPPTTTVYFDGSCPLCRREIAVYRGLQASLPLCFADVSDPALALPPGATLPALKARFHVRHADGRMDSGARAFLALWGTLPGWRWLARLGSVPGMPWVMEVAYRGFLHVRPAVQRLARWMEKANASAPEAVWMRKLLQELRSDHAGETGAVMIYRGVLAVTRDAQLRDFALHHLDTEKRHLALIESLLPPAQRSRLLPMWRWSGWLTGALPACWGPRAVYATIEAVETFVDRHYADQISLIDNVLRVREAAACAAAEAGLPGVDEIPGGPLRDLTALRALLEQCRLDEVAHRDDAHARGGGRPPGPGLRGWQALVGWGSRQAVKVCRRF